jgi:hypothetical protein
VVSFYKVLQSYEACVGFGGWVVANIGYHPHEDCKASGSPCQKILDDIRLYKTVLEDIR